MNNKMIKFVCIKNFREPYDGDIDLDFRKGDEWKYVEEDNTSITLQNRNDTVKLSQETFDKNFKRVFDGIGLRESYANKIRFIEKNLGKEVFVVRGWRETQEIVCDMCGGSKHIKNHNKQDVKCPVCKGSGKRLENLYYYFLQKLVIYDMNYTIQYFHEGREYLSEFGEDCYYSLVDSEKYHQAEKDGNISQLSSSRYNIDNGVYLFDNIEDAKDKYKELSKEDYNRDIEKEGDYYYKIAYQRL